LGHSLNRLEAEQLLKEKALHQKEREQGHAQRGKLLLVLPDTVGGTSICLFDPGCGQWEALSSCSGEKECTSSDKEYQSNHLGDTLQVKRL